MIFNDFCCLKVLFKPPLYHSSFSTSVCIVSSYIAILSHSMQSISVILKNTEIHFTLKNYCMEIESQDVIRLIGQFLKENQLHNTLKALQLESQVALNAVSHPLTEDIQKGNWAVVLESITDLAIPPKHLSDLYEQIVLELIEMKQIQAARSLLRQTDPMDNLRNLYPERYLHLEGLLNRSDFDEKTAYQTGKGKQERREMIAKELEKHVTIVEPNRLVSLLGQALKWQVQEKLVDTEVGFDLFTGAAPSTRAEDDSPVSMMIKSIKFPKKQYPESGCFSPDGTYFATGTVDGFIEIWNYLTGKRRNDLKYQQEDNMMMIETACLCLQFSPDSEYLASGAQDGSIIVWSVKNGRSHVKFRTAHTQGITCLAFNSDGTQIVSSSFDQTVRIHGLNSGKTLKVFRGHTSFVNSVAYSLNDAFIVSGSSDGTVKIWNQNSSDCIHTLHLQNGELTARGVNLPTVHSVTRIPSKDIFLVSNHSRFLYLISLSGEVTIFLVTVSLFGILLQKRRANRLQMLPSQHQEISSMQYLVVVVTIRFLMIITFIVSAGILG
ncbi:WD40-repeat-containing domain protein [Globomyces pollinis-pini]|nr:WD40-repeat-containing domain protein [Globomyces pollinis-pini]